MRCLEKKAADRWQSAEEMLPHMETAGTPSGGVTPTDTRPLTAASLMPAKAAAPRSCHSRHLEGVAIASG